MKGLYYDGRWQKSTTDDRIDVENPLTQEIIGSVIAASEADVNAAVASAKKAQKNWKDSPLTERIALVKKLAIALEKREVELAEVIRSELGCGKNFALEGHFRGYIKGMFIFMDEARKIQPTEQFEGFQVVKEPVGVVACLTPWNYPFGQLIQKIVPAMLMGNTVVLKPSQITPLIAVELFEEIDRVGFPPGVINLTCGRGREVGNILARHPDVNMITFTGSTSGGREIARLAADSIKRVILELGGKSAAVILEGADLNLAAKRVLFTVCSNVGQTCSAHTRLLYPRELESKVIKALQRQAAEYSFATASDHDATVGVLSSKKQLDKVTRYVREAVEQGSELVIGEVPKEQEGYYTELMVLRNVDPKSPIAQEEVFGPVLVMIPYDSEEEALELANDTMYGLGGGVFGPPDKAYAFARQMDTGTVIINDGSGSGAPFGGFKQSGYGREGGRYGLLEFVELKTLFTKG